MAELLFEEHADAALSALEGDPTRGGLLRRVNEVLDLLEADPGDRRLRRRRYQVVDAWGIPIHADDEDWLILWDFQDSDVVAVRYLGPDLRADEKDMPGPHKDRVVGVPERLGGQDQRPSAGV